jgi:hypothetical protein
LYFQAIRALLHVVEDPTGWDDLRKFDGVTYNSFVEAARARHLLNDDALWQNTVRDALIQLKNLNQRIRWLAMFFTTTRLKEPEQMLEYAINIQGDFLINTSVAKKSFNDKKQFVLRQMEWFLRAFGITPDDVPRPDGTYESACEQIGLPRPAHMPPMDQNAHVQVTYF